MVESSSDKGSGSVAGNGKRAAPGAAFREGFIEADGFRIRYAEAGEGVPLVHLHGAGGLRLTPAHDLLARHFRVIAFEMPGFGHSPENTRTRTLPELALTMARAADALRRVVEADPEALPAIRDRLDPVEDELWEEAGDVLERPDRWGVVGQSWGWRALHALRSCIK